MAGGPIGIPSETVGRGLTIFAVVILNLNKTFEKLHYIIHMTKQNIFLKLTNFVTVARRMRLINQVIELMIRLFSYSLARPNNNSWYYFLITRVNSEVLISPLFSDCQWHNRGGWSPETQAPGNLYRHTLLATHALCPLP